MMVSYKPLEAENGGVKADGGMLGSESHPASAGGQLMMVMEGLPCAASLTRSGTGSGTGSGSGQGGGGGQLVNVPSYLPHSRTSAGALLNASATSASDAMMVDMLRSSGGFAKWKEDMLARAGAGGAAAAGVGGAPGLADAHGVGARGAMA